MKIKKASLCKFNISLRICRNVYYFQIIISIALKKLKSFYIPRNESNSFVKWNLFLMAFWTGGSKICIFPPMLVIMKKYKLTPVLLNDSGTNSTITDRTAPTHISPSIILKKSKLRFNF